MLANAYGPEQYVYGQGKGFPNALPQTSVGSTNTFARRAIARRAVTNVNTKQYQVIMEDHQYVNVYQIQ